MRPVPHVGMLLAAMSGLALTTEGISDEVKDIWNDAYNEPNTKRVVHTADIPLSIEAMERISQAEAKRLRKQAKCIKQCLK